MQLCMIGKFLQVFEIDCDDLVFDVVCGLGYFSVVIFWLVNVVIVVENNEKMVKVVIFKFVFLEIDNVVVV